MPIPEFKYAAALYCIALITVLFANCNPIVEPVSYGDYYVTNNTSEMLIIEAFSMDYSNNNPVPVDLLSNRIYSGDKTYIYTAIEGSGGHVRPSNFWDEFYVYKEVKADSTLIYSGIEDSDWEFEATNDEGHQIYNLYIN